MKKNNTTEKKPSIPISDEEVRTWKIKNGNVYRQNLDAIKVIRDEAIAGGASIVEAYAAVGVYMAYFVDSLLDGLNDPPPIKEVEKFCGTREGALLAYMSMSNVKEQIKSTRKKVISGEKSKGNTTNHPTKEDKEKKAKEEPVLCPNLAETVPLPEDVEDVTVPFR